MLSSINNRLLTRILWRSCSIVNNNATIIYNLMDVLSTTTNISTVIAWLLLLLLMIVEYVVVLVIILILVLVLL